MRPLALYWSLMLWVMPPLAAVEPVILNVQAEQITGTRWVDISYEIRDPDSAAVSVYLKISADSGQTWEVPTASATGAVGRGIQPGIVQHVRWDSSVDLANRYSKTVRFKLGATDWEPAAGMNLIREGFFEMAGPSHTVWVSEYAMDVYEITKELWDSVRQWSLDHGYLDLPIGQSFGTEHPVNTVSWFDCVKWCNARSEMEGMKPAYTVDSAGTMVYRSGRIAPHVDWQTGYRLPTEAEWEKAARGGATGHRFPWSDSEKITPDRANYDESEKSGSVKVGSYPPNGFGLYDMAGNHFEWCWDRFGDYTSDPQTDPRGPNVGVHRVFRGGGWYDNAKNCEIANRRAFTPETVYNRVGFRSVLPTPARPWLELESKNITVDSHPRWIVNGRETETSVKAGKQATVRLSNRFERGQIFYSIDGSQPTVLSRKYTGEFTVDQSIVLRELHLNEELTETLELPQVQIRLVPSVSLKWSVAGEGKLECSPQQDQYLQGESVRVRAIPGDGWRWVRWEGDLSGEQPEATLILSTHRAVRAVFEPIPRHELTIEARGGRVSGAGTYAQFERVVLQATAIEGWEFLGWSGDYVSNNPKLSWEVKAPAHLVATFGTTLNTVATGGGKIALEPAMKVYPYGSKVRVMAIPDLGYGLSLWGGAGVGQTQNEWTLTITNAQPKIAALFGPVLKPCP